MDPISLVIAALAAGAVAGLKDTASQAVRDGYASFKALLASRFAGNQQAEAALDNAELQPGLTQVLLAEHLRAAGADGDDELLQAARALLEHVGNYNVRIMGGKGIVVGDAAHVTMSFNDDD
jgi:hypothetical protein